MSDAAPVTAAPAPPAAGGAPAAPSASSALSNTPAAAPAAPATGAPATPAASAAPAADWLNGLPETTRGFVTNKGWKSNAEVLDSYQNLEKLVGAPQDKIIKLPADDDKAGWDSVYSRLGRPADPKEYSIVADKEKGGDPAFAEWASKNFHELGLSTKQGQSLVAKFAEYTGNFQKTQEAAQIQRLQEGATNLKKEWGAAYEQNVQIAKRGAAVQGVDKGLLDKIESAIGFDGVMKLFHGFGAKTGESAFVQGQGGNGALTPQAAMDKISALKADPGFVKRYTGGDATARAEMQRLHEMAHQGELTI